MSDQGIGWWPVKSAARVLGVSRQRVHQLLASGALVGRKMDATVLVNGKSVVARFNEKGARSGNRRDDR